MPSVYIKLKPYLQEFLKSRLNEDPSSSLRTIIGATITPFIERLPKGVPPLIGQSEEYIEIDLKRLDDSFNQDIRGTNYISPRNQEHISRILDAHFEDLFFQYMDDKKRYDIVVNNKRHRKGQLKLIILSFCSENNIPFNQVTYEMLKKKYYRREVKFTESFKNIARSALILFV